MSKSGKQPSETKTGVSVSDMAQTVGLSRQRFHQLIKEGVFPQPLRDESSGRPYYDESGQAQCSEVRRRNCGVNGKVVLFYARRQTVVAAPSRPKQPQPTRPVSTGAHAEILDGVRALGLAQTTAAQVNDTIKESFPNGTFGVSVGEVIRAVFLQLRKNTGDNVG